MNKLFYIFNVMLFQEAKNLDFHMKSPEIINVGKIIHILKNTVQPKENIDSSGYHLQVLA